MADLDTLLASGALIPVQVELGTREQPMRLLYGVPGFIQWLETFEPPLTVTANSDSTPEQQLDYLFYTFITGRRLVHPTQFRVIKEERNPVWELKTPDLRLFGWFLRRDCFVACFGDWADKVKDHDLYRGYRLEVRRLRRELGVGESLCVPDASPNEVLSL